MPDQIPENLSAHRGNSWGIRFFQALLALGGVRVASAFIPVVTFFYALFDRTAFQRCEPYLRLRFPNAGSFGLKRHFHRLITEQGRMILLGHAIASGKKIPVTEPDGGKTRQELAVLGKPVLALFSHFGCWQASMEWFDLFPGSAFNVLAQPDVNALLPKNIACTGKNLNLISTANLGGGLMEAMAALQRGEFLAMMGDRTAGGESISQPVLGGEMAFPLSPWLLASRTGATVVPVFALPTPDLSHIELCFGRPVPMEAPANGRVPRAQLEQSMRSYVQDYEQMCNSHPYLMFRFDGQTR